MDWIFSMHDNMVKANQNLARMS